MKNLHESFRDYVAVEMMEGENKYQAEGFGLQDAKKGILFQSFPPVLHLQLKRFEYDIQRDAMAKVRWQEPYCDHSLIVCRSMIVMNSHLRLTSRSSWMRMPIVRSLGTTNCMVFWCTQGIDMGDTTSRLSSPIERRDGSNLMMIKSPRSPIARCWKRTLAVNL